MTPLRKLDAWRWLPLEKWTATALIEETPRQEGKHYCKVCDGWVDRSVLDEHALHHRRERAHLLYYGQGGEDGEKAEDAQEDSADRTAP